LPSFFLCIFLFHLTLDVRTVASPRISSSCSCNARMGSAFYVHSVSPEVLSSECIAMGSAPYDESLSSPMLSDVGAWDGECSLPKGLGNGERSPCAVRVHGERSLCSFPLAGSTVFRSGLRWGALPIPGTGQLRAVPLWRVGLWGALPMCSPSRQ
jgi:hypothetical protein